MDNLGTEVGQKMRVSANNRLTYHTHSSQSDSFLQCAVKAKLIELGTGSTSGGYIDDELPDYVMIMVANKRSKKQMRDDLQLFLNENTDTFVNWLHQVLDKLQEVTLPPASKCQWASRLSHDSLTHHRYLSVSQKVSSGKSASAADSKKDKKSKKAKRSQKEQSPGKATDKQASITDVFADQLIGKAKRSLEIESQAPVKKQEARKEVTATLPSVQELVKNAVVNSKRKELEELEQIQKQIDEAKRQLKIIPGGEPMEAAPAEKSPEQDEDDDFLNLKADDLDDVDNDSQSKTDTEAPATTTAGGTPTQRRNRSPIVFDRFRHSRPSPEPRRDHDPRAPPKSSSAKERLGGGGDRKTENIISLSAHRQMERELYTPVHRRKEDNSNASQPLPSSRRPPRNSSSDRDSRQRHRQSDSIRDRRRSGSGVAERDRNLGHHRQRSPHRRERPASPQREPRRPFRERERDRGTPPLPSSRAPRIEVTRTMTERKESPTAPVVVVERLPVRQRIGSRVIVAPPKQLEEEEEVDVPVSSVVTIKPRPVIAKNRQANKNLLLRAMADAQKSMVGTLKQQLETPGGGTTTTATTTLRLAEGGGVKGRLGGILNIAKRQRSQINAIVSSLDPVLKRQKPNQKIIIEIGPNDGFSESDSEAHDGQDEEEVGEDAVVDVEGNGLSVSAELEYVPKPIEASATRSKEAKIDIVQVAEVEDDGNDEGADEDPAPNTQFVVTLDGAYKKAAAVVTKVRNRLDLSQRRDVMKKTVVAEKQPEVIVRTSRASSRNASAEEKIVPRMSHGTRTERAPTGPLVDLRQRVEERRNGSPAKRRLGEVTNTSPKVNNTEARPTRKRRSPIKFTDKRSVDNGESVLDAKKPIEDSLDVPTQRKRIRISNSPAREELKATANGDGPKTKSSSSVVVVSREKEKRDPKKYDNIPSCECR